MKNFEFTKDDTSIAKGIAIILMLIHHLFAFPDRIQGGAMYISLFPIGEESLEEIVASFGNICVAIFLFLSGFGMYKKIANSNENKISIIIKKLKELYINYWIIFVIFIPISFLIGIRHFDFEELLNNLIGFRSTYNGEWWFFEVYVFMMIIYPLTIKIIKENSVISILCLILLNEVIRTFLPAIANFETFLIITQSSMYNEILYLLGFLPCFLMGCIFGKFDLFSRMKKLFIETKLDNIIFYLLISIGIIYLRKVLGHPVCYDYLFVPVYIIATIHCIRFLRLDKLFNILGKHSCNMWLIHSFFCYQYFQGLIYFPKLTVLIVSWLAIICITCSWIIMNLINKYNKLSGKLKYKIYSTNSNSNVSINVK